MLEILNITGCLLDVVFLVDFSGGASDKRDIYIDFASILIKSLNLNRTSARVRFSLKLFRVSLQLLVFDKFKNSNYEELKQKFKKRVIWNYLVCNSTANIPRF